MGEVGQPNPHSKQESSEDYDKEFEPAEDDTLLLGRGDQGNGLPEESRAPTQDGLIPAS